MKQYKWHLLFTAIAVFFLYPSITFGTPQTSDNYTIQRYILTNAGGQASSDNYTLSHILGQSSPIAFSSSGEYNLYGGFFMGTKSVPQENNGEFHVTTTEELQNALGSAENDGIDNIIYLSAGIYLGGFYYHPGNTEHNSITIIGEPGINTEDIILDGQGVSDVLTLYHDDSSYTGDVAHARVSGVTIQNGLGSGGSGGIRIRLYPEYDISLTNCIIKENTTPGSGGGAIIEAYLGGGNITVENNIIADNTATERTSDQACMGGGLAIISLTSGRCLIRNNIIANNTATGTTDPQGGGLWLRKSCDLVGNTIYNNHATNKGGGVYCAGGNVYNNIIYGNSAAEGGDIYINGGYATGYNNCYSDILGSWSVSGSNLDTNPRLIDAEHNDFHLQSTSPCIDNGTNSAPDIPDTDFEGDPRTVDGDNDGTATVDIGADEHAFIDTDGDGLPDDWEMEYFGNLSQGPDNDYDGDGRNNMEEYQQGTNPTSFADGDVAPLGSRDGTINVGDALVALRFALLLETPTQEDKEHGDVAPLDAQGQPNPDGQINVGDALVILRKALGIIDF
ncbi:MAG: choice-of-anchor Q domain-containing protein [Thermodesulfobacteriota bacterium]|nr:choice-of-anchor Q domain-containing protein [Thermodesulfobacteriota bacterium]